MPTASFSLIDSWQKTTPADRDAIRAFWAREQAGLEGEQATRRMTQVLSQARDRQGQLIAVSTAVPRTIPRLLQPMYYFRCFVGADRRGEGLSAALLRHGFDVLDHWARARDFPCIGVLIEIENASMAAHLRNAYLHRVGFSYIGPSARGLDLRVRYFPHARLKPIT